MQHSLDSLKGAIAEAAEVGLGGVMLFGVPETKDAIGSGATDPDGILNVATRIAVEEAGDALVVQTDLCLDEFTDHGHCGVLDAEGRVDNDASPRALPRHGARAGRGRVAAARARAA